MSEIKAVYRSRTRIRERKQILNEQTATDYIRTIWNKDTLELTEDFVIVCLNTANHAIGWVKVSSGGLDAARVDPRVVFALALQVGASALILAHNHPSGEVVPSPEDKIVTKRLTDAGALLQIRVLDHIIIGKDTAFSFADHGLI